MTKTSKALASKAKRAASMDPSARDIQHPKLWSVGNGNAVRSFCSVMSARIIPRLADPASPRDRIKGVVMIEGWQNDMFSPGTNY